MNTYSRALRHINMKDVKQKHQQKLIEQKTQEEKEKQEREFIASVMEEKKYDWRKKLSEQMTTSDVFFTTLDPPENTYANPIVTTSSTSISSVNAINSNTRLITLGSFDVSTIDQFEVNATLLGSGSFPYAWVLQANGVVIAAGGSDDPIRVANASQLSLFKSGMVTLSIRQSTGSGEASDPSVLGWNINSVKFYRTVPTNVFVSLDSPEATSFIRTGSGDLSPEEKQKRLKEMLEASDEYVMKMMGLDFPGTGAVPPGEFDPFVQTPPGEAGDTPGVSISTPPTYLYPGGLVTSGKVTGLTPIRQVYPSQSQPKPKSASQKINFTHTYDVVTDSGTEKRTMDLSTTAPLDAKGNLVNVFGDEQTADKLSKAVAAARAEYLKPGQTVAQRQQSYDKLQAAIKAGTDYALGKNQTATQSQQSNTTTPVANTGLGNAIQRGIAKNLMNYSGPYSAPARVLGQYANNIYNSGGKTGGTITNPLSDDSVKDIISRIKPDAAPEIHKTDIKTMVKLSAQQFMSDFHLTFGSGGYEVELTDKGIVITDPSYKFGKGGANKLGGLDLPAAGDYAAGPLSLGTVPLGLSLFGTNPPKATATLQQTIPMSTIKSANPELYKQLQSRLKENYEPQRQSILEKKKLKSPQEVLDKIPGYYNGKPAPLGFPETPPPEMVNGMHPDLVDGKKVSDRFNRLDPESAKAMPLTGNPHIDKKVKAARKKPK